MAQTLITAKHLEKYPELQSWYDAGYFYIDDEMWPLDEEPDEIKKKFGPEEPPEPPKPPEPPGPDKPETPVEIFPKKKPRAPLAGDEGPGEEEEPDKPKPRVSVRDILKRPAGTVLDELRAALDALRRRPGKGPEDSQADTDFQTFLENTLLGPGAGRLLERLLGTSPETEAQLVLDQQRAEEEERQFNVEIARRKTVDRETQRLNRLRLRLDQDRLDLDERSSIARVRLEQYLAEGNWAQAGEERRVQREIEKDRLANSLRAQNMQLIAVLLAQPIALHGLQAVGGVQALTEAFERDVTAQRAGGEGGEGSSLLSAILSRTAPLAALGSTPAPAPVIRRGR